MSNSIRFGRYGGWVNPENGCDRVWLVVSGERVVCGFCRLSDAASFCSFLNGGGAVDGDLIEGENCRVFYDLDSPVKLWEVMCEE